MFVLTPNNKALINITITRIANIIEYDVRENS